MTKSKQKKVSMRAPKKTSRPVRRASTKKQSAVQKYFTHRLAKPILFAGLFGMIGVAMLFQIFANTGRPSKANELILQYRLPHGHHIDIAEGVEFHAPNAMLYGDGRLICSKETPDSPFDVTETRLDKEALNALYTQMLDTGITDLEDQYSDTNYVVKAAATNLIFNTSEGAKYISLMTDDKPAAFVAMEDIILQLCAQANTTYAVEEIEVFVAKLESSEADKEFPGEAGSLPDLDEKGRGKKLLKGKEAKELTRQLKKGGTAKLKKDGADYAVSAAPILPEHKLPTHKTAIDKNKVSASSPNHVKHVWAYASDQAVVPNAQSQAQDVATRIRDFYRRETSKSTSIDSVQVVQLPKPVAWYYVCRNANGCKYNGTFDPSLALFDNLFNSYEGVPRFYEQGKSMNVMVQFTPKASGTCGGWGTALSSSDPVKNNVGGFGVMYNASACYSSGYTHGIAAHEQGHTFGLSHTGDTTLMGNSGGCAFAQCKLNSWQAATLKNNSPYFSGTTASSTTTPKLNISQEAVPGMPASGATIVPGQEIGVRIRVSNSGSSAALDAIIEDAVPSYMTASWQGGLVPTGSISGISQGNSNTSPITYYWWKMASFGNSSSAYVDMKFRLNSNAPNGATICNTGSVRANNHAKVSTLSSSLCFKVSNSTTTTTPTPTYPPPASTTDAFLSPGERLYASSNATVYSPNRAYFLRMQSDGNLVLYTSSGGVVWHASTGGLGGAFVAMQSDGNLVMYKSDGATAVWHTVTKSTNAFVRVQDDAKFVILSSTGSSVIWQSTTSTGTKIATYAYPTPTYGYPTPAYGYPTPTYTYPTPTTSTNDRLNSGATLSKGGVINSANGSTRLALQTDGNLVLYYGSSTVRFATYTTTGYRLVMQTDCNLVLYNSSNGAVWQSATTGRGSGCFMKVQDDGRMAIYNSSGTFLWARP